VCQSRPRQFIARFHPATAVGRHGFAAPVPIRHVRCQSGLPGRRLDALIPRTVPGVRKAVKWTSLLIAEPLFLASWTAGANPRAT